MTTHDRAELFGDALLIQFGTTGTTRSASIVRLERGVSFAVDGTTLNAEVPSRPTPIQLETFASDGLARGALDLLVSRMRRYTRLRRCRQVAKAIGFWLAGPAVVLMAMSTLNVALMRGMSPVGPQPQPITPLAGTSAQGIEGPGAARRPPQAELARAMADGAKSGKFSVRLSRGAAGTLYVFSDPLCQHCQRFENDLDELGHQFTVHLFPVSAIGGPSSRTRNSRALCASDGDHAAVWRTIIAGRDDVGTDCATGRAAADANDAFFAAVRFTGTPTIISATGAIFPDTLPNSATTIGEWMRSTAASPSP